MIVTLKFTSPAQCSTIIFEKNLFQFTQHSFLNKSNELRSFCMMFRTRYYFSEKICLKWNISTKTRYWLSQRIKDCSNQNEQLTDVLLGSSANLRMDKMSVLPQAPKSRRVSIVSSCTTRKNFISSYIICFRIIKENFLLKI